jgi:thiol-disulfide isomerase/thioredoxin
MIKNWFWAVLMSPLALLAQEKGIAFEHNLTWNDILQKAKTEHKYVFVDCYASWCGPCKIMDRDVYPNDSLGEWMNRQFVSVKVQLDSTSHDNSEIQKWYPIAHQLERDYKIRAYPSFLFFSPDGQVVDKKVGGRDVKGVMGMAYAAMDPTQQFYSLLAQNGKGNKSYPEERKLAGIAKAIGEDSLYKALVKDYMRNYLLPLPAKQRWTRDNIGFLTDYGNVITGHDNLFKRYYKERNRINEVMNDTTYADRLINWVIYHDLVKPAVQQGIKTNLEPQWFCPR